MPERITMGDAGLVVPDQPILPFIEGDGIGPDIWSAAQRVFDAAVEHVYHGDRRVEGRDGYDADVRANLAAGVDEVLTLAQDMGGAMEYCHGVGVKLTHLLPREMGVGFEVARAIKRALDPHEIMNPGKLF